ncbi:uncharacterized protein LOC142152851 [Mixophyes fleayi]|uniref:uncharacterized protein LOC142152851 n=1 Tax=Mixophyes fleayi TaxID=3061075 RepID=UPI003F4D8D5E
MCSNNVFTGFIMFFSIHIASGQLMQKVPIGSDITLTCQCPKAAGPNCSASFPLRDNVKEFHYEDSLYIVISNILKNNHGSYRCMVNYMQSSVITVELSELKTKDEIVMFRAVGDDLLLVCPEQKKNKSVKWQWTSSDSLHNDIIEVKSVNETTSTEHFSSRLKTSNAATLAIKISPVRFMDYGKYKCSLAENNMGTTINLVTVKVNAHPASSDLPHSNVSLTCSLSHFVNNKRISLVWVQISGTGSSNGLPVKSQNVTSEFKEHTIFLKNINEVMNWTCLVFSENLLVALAPITLNYTRALEPQPTGISHISARKQVMYSVQCTESMKKGSSKKILALVISATIVIVMVYVVLIMCSCRLLNKSGDTENQSVDSKTQDVQYVSVRFSKKWKGDAKDLGSDDILPDKPAEHEILYADIKQDKMYLKELPDHVC